MDGTALATRRPGALRSLVDGLDELVAAEADSARVAAGVAALLEPALADTELIEPQHREPYADRYRQHLVHVDPDGRYSIVTLVWRPGHATPIHDHQCWCVVGVWRGIERETSYELRTDGEREWLAETSSSLARPGHVTALVPPEEDIHKVENAGDRLAISLHVYGADIARLGSSINHVFDEPVLLASMQTATSVAWRDARSVAG
jgi:predicted metal-dependent enzyme (double-stranded beta helix superfamily)